MKKSDYSDLLSPGFKRKKERIVLAVGRETITYRELGGLVGPFTSQAASRLNLVLIEISGRSKNILDLAAKINFDTLMDIGGVGEATVELWLAILKAKGMNPVEWLDSNLKILTRCQKSRRKTT